MTQEELKIYMEEMSKLIQRMGVCISTVIPKDQLTEDDIKELRER